MSKEFQEGRPFLLLLSLLAFSDTFLICPMNEYEIPFRFLSFLPPLPSLPFYQYPYTITS